MKVDLQITSKNKVEGKRAIFQIEGLINGQMFYASFNSVLNRIVSSSIYGQEWDRIYLKLNECYRYALHNKIVEKLAKQENERKLILNKKLVIKKQAVKVVKTILKMSKILANPSHGPGMKKAAKRIRAVKELELKDLQWQYGRFIG